MQLTSQGRLRADLIDHVFHYGTPGDQAVSGDWNGDGIEAVGIFRQRTLATGRRRRRSLVGGRCGLLSSATRATCPSWATSTATASTTSACSAPAPGSSTRTATASWTPKTKRSNSATRTSNRSSATSTATAPTTPASTATATPTQVPKPAGRRPFGVCGPCQIADSVKERGKNNFRIYCLLIQGGWGRDMRNEWRAPRHIRSGGSKLARLASRPQPPISRSYSSRVPKAFVVPPSGGIRASPRRLSAA